MNLVTFLFLALSLSLDTFAVSITSGIAIHKLSLHFAFRFSLFFGLFQALMLLVGWLTGLTIKGYFQNLSHWLAFFILCFIGLKMIYESFYMKKENNDIKFSFIILTGLAFATSIDALSIGISFSLLGYHIMMPVAILGLVTFSVALSGIYIGDKFGSFFENRIELIGGLILIFIGLHILLQGS